MLSKEKNLLNFIKIISIKIIFIKLIEMKLKLSLIQLKINHDNIMI